MIYLFIWEQHLYLEKKCYRALILNKCPVGTFGMVKLKKRHQRILWLALWTLLTGKMRIEMRTEFHTHSELLLSMFLFQMFFFPLTGKMSTSEFLPTHCLHWWFTWVVTVKQLVLSRELKSTSPQETSRLPQWLSGKEPACNAADAGEVTSAPGSGRSPGGRNGNPLQDQCLENPADRGAWRATVHGVAKSRTWLSYWTEMNWCYLSKM